jgi:5'-nucleotidase (lipoprotein e(P4) family)
MRIIIFLMTFSLTFIYAKLPNDVRWIKESKEYKALCHQVYNNAINKLENNIAPNKYSLNIVNNNYAVVMDLDETVLNNSDYQVELYNKKEKYNPDSWDKWVLKEEAELVPGSYDYISFLRSNDIQIIFISNRMHKRLEETKNNMKKLGIYSEGDIYLLRIDRADKKTIRRAEIFDSSGRMKGYNQFKIIQYLGDAIGDFEVETLDRFGLDQFVFPNPMYGKW